ncbi:MAG: transporter substrate-binding domain-containing protein [Methylocystaceae bacterium]|nr:transporter substrate-binding domain-containing protein [Methylocystaceae bacterium]
MVRFILVVLVLAYVTSQPIKAVADDDLRYEFLLSPIPPLVMSARTSEQKGLLWDVAKRLLEQLAATGNCICKDVPTVLPWTRAVNVMTYQPGKFMLQMARTPERENLYDWIMPVSEITFAFVTQKIDPPNTIDEARDLKRIAVYRGSRLEKFLRSKGFDRTLTLTNNSSASARLLNHDRVDAWYASVNEALWLYKNNEWTLPPKVGDPILTFPVWLIASKGTPKDKQDRVKSVLQGMFKDGSIQNFQATYGLDIKRMN